MRCFSFPHWNAVLERVDIEQLLWINGLPHLATKLASRLSLGCSAWLNADHVTTPPACKHRILFHRNPLATGLYTESMLTYARLGLVSLEQD